MNTLKVLIPTDFSVQADYAYLLVQNLAKKIQVEIHFLHVLNVPETVSLNPDGTITTCGEIDVKYVESQRDIAMKKLSDLKQQYDAVTDTHLVFGKLSDQVSLFAHTHQFDLIAMGTKGAWGWKDKLSGTETQFVARKSSVPVLSLMCDRSDLSIENILLVHQFSEAGEQPMDLLHKLVAAFDPNIHFLQIDSNPTDDRKAVIERDMMAFAAANRIKHFVPHIIKDSDVESGVIHFNQMNDMDMVCIGTHGRAGLFHTSATEKLIKHMFKPIISFHLKNN